MSKRSLFALLLLFGFLSLGLVGCSDDDEVIGGDDVFAPEAGPNVELTCEGCHTGEAYLRATALPDPEPTEPEGEG